MTRFTNLSGGIMPATKIHADGDTTIWKIECDGQFVACGSALDYEEAWGKAMEASNDYIDWSDNPTDEECDISMLCPVDPTVRDIRGYTFSTGPVA